MQERSFNFFCTVLKLYWLSPGQADGFYRQTFELLEISSCPVLWFYRGFIFKTLRDKTMGIWEVWNQLWIFCGGAWLMFPILLVIHVPKICLTWTFPCIYFDVSQFYIINILIRKFARESENLIHIWNYLVNKLNFKICAMKLDLIQMEKLLAWNFTHKRKSITFVSSAKCSILLGKMLALN